MATRTRFPAARALALKRVRLVVLDARAELRVASVARAAVASPIKTARAASLA